MSSAQENTETAPRTVPLTRRQLRGWLILASAPLVAGGAIIVTWLVEQTGVLCAAIAGIPCPPADVRVQPAVVATFAIVVLLIVVVATSLVLRNSRAWFVPLIAFALLAITSIVGPLLTLTAGGFAIDSLW